MNLRFIYTIILILLKINGFAQILHNRNVTGFENLSNNSGIAAADYDQDNDLDLFIVATEDYNSNNPATSSRLLRNNNDGTFTDITEEAGLLGSYDYDEATPTLPYNFDGILKNGVSWGDFNNDGYPDLFLTSYKHNKLFKNNGDGTFSDITTSSGLDDNSECYSASSVWFDYNNDGLLDILISSWAKCQDNRFYQNNGDETFIDISSKIATAEYNNTWMVLPWDINNDNWIDLLFVNDFREMEIFINNNGTYSEKAADYGIVDGGSNMGAAYGDLNLDGDFDLYITDIEKNTLWSRHGNTYYDSASILNIDSTKWSWNTECGDIDLDGLEDIIVANGHAGFYDNYIFKNTSENNILSFNDVSDLYGFDTLTNSTCFELFDYDHDGDLDIAMTDLKRKPVFFDNQTISIGEDSDPNWLKVKLTGTNSNRDAIGSTITISLPDNRRLMRYHTGAGFMKQSLQPVHFGVEEASIIPTLEILWPSGLKEIYSDLPINSTIGAVEGSGITIKQYSHKKIFGCTDPESCNYNPLATVNDGSCTYLSSHDIIGPSTSGIFRNETYSYDTESENAFIWSISNGEILSGQNSKTVNVRWGIGSKAVISVKEIGVCNSLSSSFDVVLEPSKLNDEDYSVARLWNEVLLDAIRHDYARPTVHARNLFHISAAMYDSWQVLNRKGAPYFLTEEYESISETFDFSDLQELKEAERATLSYATFRMLDYRFRKSPGYNNTFAQASALMNHLGYDIEDISTDYSNGEPKALGNYLASKIIEFGKTDGSRELSSYDNEYYQPFNPPLSPQFDGNPLCQDPNRWQPLQLHTFIDQSGNLIEGDTPEFLSPEWGNVVSFSLTPENMNEYSRSDNLYNVFHDPGTPPLLDEEETTNEQYQWGFTMVSLWGSHLDPNDGIIWDISPASIGNIDFSQLPTEFSDFDNFYSYEDGGDISQGRSINPVTNQPYENQNVPRGDYTRVLAEFWADGPESETPPGHWFTLLNYVSDHEALSKQLTGEGEVLSDLEWDVKSYFVLGGAMHDAAISAWSIKGWYDYIRPISAIRYMADQGQSSEPLAEDYSVSGIPLVPGYIERVAMEDDLVGQDNENVGKLKLFTWRGHDYINDVNTDQAGVGWILAEDWWPYQRPSFVTPPFAGFVSGHSTFSRAAAEVLTLLTGDEYFPGGLGEFVAKKDEFLVFEQGPSVDVKLQWATYRDASDQCSLSRIWGGIHPPADDIPGRIIGQRIGIDAFKLAKEYFDKNIVLSADNKLETKNSYSVYPNPIESGTIRIEPGIKSDLVITDVMGKQIPILQRFDYGNLTELKINSELTPGVYILSSDEMRTKIFIK